MDQPQSASAQSSRASALPRRASQAPDAAERQLIADARKRIADRRPRLTTRLELDDEGKVSGVGPEHTDREGWIARLQDLFGTHGTEFALDQLNHVLNFTRGSGRYDRTKANALLAAVEAVRPSNEIEASLALQMAITNELTLQALSRAQRVDTINQYQSAAGMAVKLMRTYAMQVEALAKLQRGGQQVVKVIHVHPGGQAIVGNVTASAARSGGGGSDEFGDQPHAKGELPAPAAQPMPPLRSQDAERERVPVAGSEG